MESGTGIRFQLQRKKCIPNHCIMHPKDEKRWFLPERDKNFRSQKRKARRKLISQVVAENQLFFSVACTMNDVDCAKAMMWFREMIYFSRDYSDIPRQLLEYPNDANILRAISNYAKAADVGIEDMRFEINGKQIDEEAASSEEIRAELVQFMRLLSETSNDSETNLKAISIHQGKDKIGKPSVYTMELADESDGTRKLMALAPRD